MKSESFGRLLYLSGLIILFLGEQPVASDPVNRPKPVFQIGDGGYACFRIPAIVKTNHGVLLAFAEARKHGCSDTGDIDLVLRRSGDSGKTWEPLQVLWDAGPDVVGNPSPVVDVETGTVWLLVTRNLGTDTEPMIIDGTSEDTRRIFILGSDDDGKTFSKPEEITASVKKASWTWYATGPVHGIQLTSGQYRGRLVIPCDHIEAVTKKYYSHIIYSDDHGKNWQLGGSTPQDQVNECTVAELPGGRLMLNMRNYNREHKNRKISLSDDGGNTWSDLKDDPELIEPICQASLMTVSGGNKEVLCFLNPADTVVRKNLTLKLSIDNGKTWRIVTVLHKGPAAYSDMVQLNHSTLGCLYEAGEASPYEGIYFQRVTPGFKK